MKTFLDLYVNQALYCRREAEKEKAKGMRTAARRLQRSACAYESYIRFYADQLLAGLSESRTIEMFERAR